MLGASGSSGGAGFFLLLIVAFGFLYFVLIRPQRRRQQQSQQMLSGLQPGDEVVTAGGIYGTIVSVGEDDDLILEIAPNLQVRVARRAVGGVVNRPGEEPDEAPEEEDANASTQAAEPPPEA